MPAVMSTMRERRQWRAGDQKVDKIEMERFTALEVERVKRVVSKQEVVRSLHLLRTTVSNLFCDESHIAFVGLITETGTRIITSTFCLSPFAHVCF